MALHYSTVPDGDGTKRDRTTPVNRTSDEKKSDDAVAAQPIAGHDGDKLYPKFRIPKVTKAGLLATDGSAVTQPVSDDISRRLAETAFLNEHAQLMSGLDPNRGFEVR